MKESRVSWSISADVYCPHCEHLNDFMNQDEWYVFTKPGENVEEFHSPYEMTCEECGQNFLVTGSDY